MRNCLQSHGVRRRQVSVNGRSDNANCIVENGWNLSYSFLIALISPSRVVMTRNSVASNSVRLNTRDSKIFHQENQVKSVSDIDTCYFRGLSKPDPNIACSLLTLLKAALSWTVIELLYNSPKVIRCYSFLMMPTMTQSGSCIDPCKEIYSLGSRCRLKVFEILLRLLFLL
jgi:hypothetical protein